jgi:uncharacterized Zn finger protein
MSERIGHGPWARLLASAVVRDEGSSVAERGRTLVREGQVGPIAVEQGTLAAEVAGHSASITALPMPPRIWAAMTRFARGNRPLEDAVEGRAQSMHFEHLMMEDWSEPLVPRPYDLGRHCTCDREAPCEHVAALAFAVADGIDADPSLLLRWRGCVTGAELPQEAAVVAPASEPAIEPTDDDDPWRASALPDLRPPRPLPVGAVLKRLGPSGLKLRGEDVADVLQRAYASFAESAEG